MASSIICVLGLTFTTLPVFLATLPFAMAQVLRDSVSSFFPARAVHAEQTELLSREEETSGNVEDLPRVREGRARTNLRKMPWKIVPFVLSMFILVEALDTAGWIDSTADLLTSFIGNNAALAVFVMITLASLACNVMNNQPMAILFSRIIQSSRFLPGNAELSQLSLFAVALASNFGANLTLIGALAGILWSDILQRNQQEISYVAFARTSLLIMPAAIAASGLVLWAEFKIFPSI